MKQRAALGVREHHRDALHGELEQVRGEARVRLRVGRLDQQVGTVAEAQRGQLRRRQLGQAGERDLGAGLQPEVDPGVLERGSQVGQRRLDRRRIDVVVVVDVGGGHDRVGARIDRRAGERERSLDRGGTVVEPGQDVDVQVNHRAGATVPLVAMPETVVMKFGGTSVADAERIKRAARRIAVEREAGRDVVAVLSARGSTTDELLAMAEEVSPRPDPRELDLLLSTGESISCALCAMAIHDLGHRAVSLTGSQAGIVTDTSHTKARILDVRADRITRVLAGGAVALVAGFQGISSGEDEVTTLGRGGSDTTAVALAAAVRADVCEIYTDVPGVFSADPRIVADARKLPMVSFEEMLEMAASGARVLQLRAVEYARLHGVRIHCRSSFDDAPGTVVLSEEESMEKPLITAVAHSTDEARVTLLGVPDRPGVAGRIFGALADVNVDVDMIVQNEPLSEGAEADISFTVPRSDLDVTRATLAPMRADLFSRVATDDEIGKVSLIGAGMKSHPGVAATVFRVLGDEDINIQMIDTSTIKITCVIRGNRVNDAVRALHAAFELGANDVEPELPFDPARSSA